MKNFIMMLILSSLVVTGLNAQPALVEVITTNVSCNGFSDGSATIRITGGTAPYTYTIFYAEHFYTTSNVLDTFYTFSNIEARTWNVLVEDVNNDGFSVFKAATVRQPQPLNITSVSIIPITCTGAANATIVVAAEGESGNYSYELMPGSMTTATGSFSPLGPGTYTVTVTDISGCLSSDVTDPILISNPSLITVLSESSANSTCYQANNGTISISGGGGTPPYTYTLNPGAIQSNGTGNFTGLAPNDYTVSVTDANNCLAATSSIISISEPDELIISSSTLTHVTCNGGNNGKITVVASGGTAPYLYTLNPGNIVNSTGIFTGLVAGNYSISVRDGNGCALSSPFPLSILQPSAIIVSLAKTNIICHGDADGTITVTASGGTPPYRYSRDNINWQDSNLFTGLSRNNYTIFVRDASLCVTSRSILVDEPDELQVSSESRVDNNKCYGDELGEIRILEVDGGTEPYEYSINGGLTFSPGSTFQNLPAGNYQTVVRDAKGCLATGNLNIINQPSEIIISSYSQVNISGCYGSNNGQISIAATGGTGIKQYSLDGGAWITPGIFSSLSAGSHLISIIDSSLCTKDTLVNLIQPAEIHFASVSITHVTTCAEDLSGVVNFSATGGTGVFQFAIDGSSFGPSGSFSGLSAGSHSISVRDDSGCRKDSTIIITGPAALAIQSQSSTNITCNGAGNGSITINASGGTTPYTFTLVPGGTLVNNGIFNNLTSGNYSVEVRDVNGCGPVSSTPVSISEPPALSIDSLVSKKITCSGATNGEIRVYPAGGTPPYQVSINNGTNFFPQTIFTNLTPRVYQVIIRDANGCILPAGNVPLTNPPALTIINQSKTDVTTCFDDPSGEITFTVGGGAGAISYSIDNGNTWQSNSTFSALTGGEYSIIARDENGCTLTSSLISIARPPAITAIITTTPYTDESSKGSLTISNASGGTGTLEFSINGNTDPFSTVTVYNDLNAGMYPVVIRDANACLYEENVIVSAVIPLDVTITLSHITCFGYNDGSIQITVSNATGQAEYSIDGGSTWSTSNLYEALGPRTYQVWVRDEESRYYNQEILINEPVQLSIFRNVTPASCNAFSKDGAIDVTVIGTSGTVNYEWSNGSTTEDLENIAAGDYQLTATDANNCTVSDNITVPAITKINADAGRDTAVCFGDELRLQGSGGTTLRWTPTTGLSNPNSASPVVETLTDISYVLRVEGINDCYNTDTVQITVYPRLGLNAGSDTTVVENQSVIINTTGGPYLNYLWQPSTGVDDPASASPEISILQTTTYIVSAETDMGCIDRDTITITLADRLIVYNAFSPNDDGINDYWDIDYAWLYPQITVEVFNRWGERLFGSKGYTDDKRWDGNYKGRTVPLGTYYYVIVPYPGATALTGPVTIVR